MTIAVTTDSKSNNRTNNNNNNNFNSNANENSTNNNQSINLAVGSSSIIKLSDTTLPITADMESTSSSSSSAATNSDITWVFSQIKGAVDSEEVSDADIISCIEFNHDGELLATGDKGGRIVIFQRDQSNKFVNGRRTSEYNVYSTFQSHEPEFDYLKSLEIEEKINKIRWLKRKNVAHFLISTNDKTAKLWKISERDRRVADGNWNLRDNLNNKDNVNNVSSMYGGGSAVVGSASSSSSLASCQDLKFPTLAPMDLVVEASPRRIYANAHTYHINSISVNSDQEHFLSADDLRVNLWNFEITNQSFNVVDIKPANMEELTEVITAAEFHPISCNLFAYTSSKGTIRLCDMRQRALCDQYAKLFEEAETPDRTFFSEIIASISDIKFSHSGQYMLTRDYLTVKVWDLAMEKKPVEIYNVHEYLRARLCALYENDCIFDKFECCWSGDDSHIITGSYNNFFRTFNRSYPTTTSGPDGQLIASSSGGVMLEASPDVAKPRQILQAKKIGLGGGGGGGASRRKKDEISPDSLDYTKKILHSAWHPRENIVAVAATNNLYLFQDGGGAPINR